MLAGVVITLPFLYLFPDQALSLFIVGAVGGIFPDFDLYSGHRKTLHFPVYYALPALMLSIIGVITMEPLVLFGFIFTTAAWLHSVMDIFGSGIELRPWEGTSEKAVYNHRQKEWIKPRRFVAYDGSPGDLFLAAAFGLPVLFVFSSPVDLYIGGLLIIGVVYAVCRKQLAEIAAWIAHQLPDRIHSFIPPRYFN
jgi:hypothetical protein